MKGCYRRPGQSFPLLALLMVFIIAMVGLSVDVGNAYGQQRSMQNAANAGAYSGMSAFLASEPLTNDKLASNVRLGLAANGIAIDETQKSPYSYQIDYYTSATTSKMLLKWDGPTKTKTLGTYNMSAPVPDIVRLQVTVWNKVETFFVRIVKRETFTVNGKSDICFGGFGLGIMPIGIPTTFSKKDKDNNNFHRLFNYAEVVAPKPDGKIDGNAPHNTSGSPTPGARDNITSEITLPTSWSSSLIGAVLFEPILNDNDMPGVHIEWLDWNGGSSGASELRDSLQLPGNINVEFHEGPRHDASLPIAPIDDRFQPLDWINGATGVKASTKEELEGLLYKDIGLPFFDYGDKVGGNTSYHSTSLGKFRLVGYNVTGNNGRMGIVQPSGVDNNSKYIMVQYLGPADKGTPVACVP